MHEPHRYAWPAIFGAWLTGLSLWVMLGMFDDSRQFTNLRKDVQNLKDTQTPCSCPNVTSCTCDHEALLAKVAALEELVADQGLHIEALEHRASDGESKVLKGYQGILEQFKSIHRRLDKLEGRKPPVRRQASCGAHPPSCEGIAALGADGEPDSVTGISLCAWEPGDIWRCYQEWRAKDAKERLERAKRREAIRKLFLGVAA